MNNTYFNKDIFPQNSFNQNDVKDIGNSLLNKGFIPQFDNSYFENVLRFNRGKKVHVHMSFTGSSDFDFSGIIENTGKDYLIVSEPSTGKWHLLLSIYIDFISFDESINYGQDY